MEWGSLYVLERSSGLQFRLPDSGCPPSLEPMIISTRHMQVPLGPAPNAREDRIAALERGVRLDENEATVIGAVGSKKVNFVVDMPVVSTAAAC